MANNYALSKPSHSTPQGKVLEQRQELPKSPELDYIKHAFGQINLDASDTNISSSFLNETLSVYTLLASIQLDSYMDLFAARNIDLEKFQNLSYLDLQLIGIQDAKHRNLIMELINAFRLE